jgi:hypothetical protein
MQSSRPRQQKATESAAINHAHKKSGVDGRFFIAMFSSRQLRMRW